MLPDRTKIGGKCQSWNIQMRHFGWFSNTVHYVNIKKKSRRKLVGNSHIYFFPSLLGQIYLAENKRNCFDSLYVKLFKKVGIFPWTILEMMMTSSSNILEFPKCAKLSNLSLKNLGWKFAGIIIQRSGCLNFDISWSQRVKKFKLLLKICIKQCLVI